MVSYETLSTAKRCWLEPGRTGSLQGLDNPEWAACGFGMDSHGNVSGRNDELGRVQWLQTPPDVCKRWREWSVFILSHFKSRLGSPSYRGVGYGGEKEIPVVIS